MIQVTADTPATTEHQDPILSTQDSPRPQTANAAVDTAYRTASALIIGPAALEDKVAGTGGYG
jgi:hypothetical protein